MRTTMWYDNVRYEVEDTTTVEKNDKNEIIAFITTNKVISSTKLKENKQ